jgi:membrane protease YdiL (CAAX protease family)
MKQNKTTKEITAMHTMKRIHAQTTYQRPEHSRSLAESLSRRSLLRQTVLFLLICLGGSFLIDLIGYLQLGPLAEESAKWGRLLQVRMFIPAATAVLLMLADREQAVPKEARIFFAALLAVIAIPFALLAGGYIQAARIIQPLLTILLTGYIIVMHSRRSWRFSISQTGLAWDRYLLRFLPLLGLYILLLAVSFGLNPLFGLTASAAAGGNGGDMPLSRLLLSVPRLLVIIPLLGWLPYFGEEYGWRYYLQQRLFALFGLRRGVLLLGIIWGLWHAPVIAMGYNYPGRPLLGNIAMILFTVVIGIYLSYAVLRSRSIWPAVILHGFTNTLAPRLIAYFGAPADPVFSFGLGIFGIALLAVPAVYLLYLLPRQSETPTM